MSVHESIVEVFIGMKKPQLEKAIERLKKEYNAKAPKAAERLLNLSLLRLMNLPSTVRICLDEATNTYGFGTFLASIAVCRICLESALIVELGRKERNLETLIKKCEKSGILSSDAAKKAHELREMGNNYIHMLVKRIAEELVRAGTVRRFQRVEENVILMQVGKESDALKANTIMREIVEFLYGIRP